ncbi:hypothetical protein BD626DRAFT_533390 [Schizophyllum amplum]|uniref:Hydrophobin n=1 Tax=Schizophyllum amplum TaxID=97359 RepID=A0A550CYR4_9AGAR|nr:hypothetical protein BD626DRAFT_533390 [Auriculariopsis ampla]
MRFFSALFLALPALAVATAIPRTDTCNTGSVYCCNVLDQSTDNGVTGPIGGLLGITLGGIGGIIWKNCTPTTIIGLGGGCNANAQTVCCENASANGIFNGGCKPLAI